MNCRMSTRSFWKWYPKLIRGGLACIAEIHPPPLLFLIFTLEAKLRFLVLWIVSIIIIAVFLILVDYKHYQYEDLLEKERGQSTVKNILRIF